MNKRMRIQSDLLNKFHFPQNRRLSLSAIGLGLLLLAGGAHPVLAAGRQALPGHIPAVVSRLQPLGRLSGTNHLQLAIGLPLRNEQALDDLLREIYDPASPLYRQYLTPEQFTERFGPTEADYQTLADFLRAQGLAVTRTHPNRVVLDVQGTVADIERVFHVTLHTYAHPTEARDFYAPDAEPSVDLAVPLLHVSGLDNFALPRPASLLTKVLSGSPSDVTPNSGGGPGGTYKAADLRAAYVPGVALTGSGQSVALVQFAGYVSNDIAAWLSANGISGAGLTLTNVPVNGGVSTPGPANGEVCLDIEMVIAMAPGISNIYVYEAPNGSTAWSTMLSQIANDNLARQVSSSWSSTYGSSSADPTSEGIFKQMASQGMSYFNASGDYDAYPGAIPFPTDSTNITQVGGTVLTTTGAGGAYVSETVWNDRTVNAHGGNWGSSGGISTAYTIPYWQQGISMALNGGSTTWRNVPDVALTAKNIFIIADTNQQEGASGTSCAAPLWAGFTALVNQQAVANGKPVVGFINPAIYAIGKGPYYTADFHDITNGDNTWSGSSTKFYATNGYDLCTGWGTPNGTNLINALASPDALIVTPGAGFASSGPVGGPFNVTSQNFSLTNSGVASLNWSVLGIPSWLNVAPGSGTLAAGASTSVSVSLNATANTLGVGAYTATLSFSNQATHVVQNRQFSLNVLASDLVQNGGFEASSAGSTDFLPSWTVSNNDSYNYVDNGTLTYGIIQPHSGTNFAAFGQYSANGLCTISQSLPTAPGQIYVLSYWWESVDFGYGTVPNELKVVWNGITQLDQVNAGVVGWTNQRFNLTATGTSTTLLFGCADDNAFLALDDVSVVAAPKPILARPTFGSGNVNLSWSAMAGLNYQLQYKTNLLQANWINLGGVTNAAGTSINWSDTNAFVNSPRRFYRIQMSP